MLASLALVVSLISGQGYAPVRPAVDPLDQQREQRVMRLGKKFRCAVCQGVAISDSPASMARAQLDKVRELVAQDRSDEEIETYFIARYGEWVLLEPKKDGLNAFLWLGPVLLLGVGLVVILSQVKKKTVATVPVEAPASDDFLAQVRADLDKP
ncbi:MAG: Cytochrome c heme lyase subunit CcmL [Myxococcaceae bacterium]|nr:Cytochrome c heme lyase subunit CcmL [Myxococcaceae bacterium]